MKRRVGRQARHAACVSRWRVALELACARIARTLTIGVRRSITRARASGASYAGVGLGCALGCATLVLATDASAEPLRVHGTIAGARAISGHQSTELGFGADGRAALELPFLPVLGVELSVSEIFLSSGELPEDPRLAALGSATSTGLAAGLRLLPLAKPGPFLALHGGVAFTGGLTRPLVDAELGYDFSLTPCFALGPVVGLEHVFQSDDELRPDDANVLFVGLHGVWDSAPQGPKDRDRDGIVDELDHCPTNPEDRDGFEDQDGCPDPDNDQDGVLDGNDRCPTDPEDKDGFDDHDGCPERDNDQDSLPDPKDSCPNEPEDKDDFQDEDGCPDPDNDNDGVPDVTDQCPLEPETQNGYADDDGCPDEDQIRVVGDKIVLDDRVHFWVNSHIIRRESWPLLERLAKLLKDHPEYIHVDIAGHADPRGPEWYNKRVSERRADSVLEFLVERGIARERLSSQGLGEQNLRVEGSREVDYWENRRVEFTVTRAKVPPKPPASTQAPPAGPAPATKGAKP
jgi:outer membrane protein OmpA-like peptidoglycan-associated protein